MEKKQELEVGSFEAKNRLSALIEEASRGKRIWITRRGKRVALLSSGVGSSDVSPASLLVKFRRIRSQAKKGPASLKQLIEEGRH